MIYYLPKSSIFCKYVRLWRILFVCLFVDLCVCLHRDTGRNFYQINTKLHSNIDSIPGQRCIVFGDPRSQVKVTVTSNILFTKLPVTQWVFKLETSNKDQNVATYLGYLNIQPTWWRHFRFKSSYPVVFFLKNRFLHF
jgi:hypothetical protein